MPKHQCVLIIGGSGYVGSRLALHLRDHYKVVATYYTQVTAVPGITYIPMNVDNRNWIKRIIHTFLPEVVIYAAGNDRKGYAEHNSKLAERAHAIGPSTITNYTDMLQPKFIYLSNSYVFDGAKGNYHETDTVLPINSLGKIKISGENVVRSKSLHYIILRCSPLFGRGFGNEFSFLDKLRMKLDRQQKILMATDELHSFASIEGLCEVIYRLINSGLKNKVLHYGGLTKVNYLEFAKNFASFFGYDPKLILARSQLQSPTIEITRDFSLNCTPLYESLKVKPLLLEESFDLLKKKLVPGL